MIKQFVTTIVTEWDTRGEVTVDQINETIAGFMELSMMTHEVNLAWAFKDRIIDVKTNAIPPDILSKELRKKILEDQTFLSEFAHSTFMGDGLEYDHAHSILSQEDDSSLIDDYIMNYCGQNPGIKKEIKALGKWPNDAYDGDEEGEES